MKIGNKLGKVYDFMMSYKDYKLYKQFKINYGLKFTHWRKHIEIIRYPELYSHFTPKMSSIIIDVGAQYGDWSMLWAKKYDSGVLALELLRSNYKEMLKDMKLNKINIIPMNLAIGNGQNIAVENSKGMAYNRMIGYADTKTYTLDELIEPNELDIIKIDVEGFEYEVLEGATNLIKRFHPRIIIETHSKELRKKCDEFLINNGYKLDFEGRTVKGKGWMDEVTNLFYIGSG